MLFAGTAFAQDNNPGLISGSVISQATQNPLPGITVRVLETNLGAFTDNEGKFTIKNIPPGTYAVQFTGVGFEKYVQSNVRVTAGRPVSLSVELAEKVIELEGAEVRSSYFQKKVETATSTQTFNAEDIRRAPGVQEDVIRAAALLPGVGVTQAGRNDLVVRGGAPFENLFIVDDIEVPNINHFGTQGTSGGPLSLINIDLVRNVEFSSGGFGARYGDKLSSITNIKLRKGNDQRLGGQANLSATGVDLIFEGPAGDDATFFVSARRSYLDFIFDAAGFGFVPEYWDFQAKADYRLDSKNSFSFLSIGALGTVRLNNDDPDKRYDNSRVAVPEQKQYFSGLTWKHLFKNGFSKITLGRTYTSFDIFQNDSNLVEIFSNRSYEGETSLKAEVDFLLSKNFEFAIGNTVKYASMLDYDIKLPGFFRLDDQGVPQPYDTDTSMTAFKNATFGTFTFGLGQSKLTVGGRMDYFDFLDNKLYFSPRLSYIYQLNELSAIVASGGRYYQSPSYIWLIGGSGSLDALRADQVVVGYQHTPLEDVKVQVEFYHKWYANYPARIWRPQAVLSPSGFDDVTKDIPYGIEPLNNSATGISYGAEIFIQKKLSDIPVYGLMSLSLSKTEFTSISGESRPGAFDTRFIMNISGGWRPADDWEISGKFRVATGIPTTPFNPDGTLDYTRYNVGDRLPVFHALDLRVDKRWDIGSSFGLITYIDIQNIYGQKNVSEIRWDYRQMEAVRDESIGVLPSIGVRFLF